MKNTALLIIDVQNDYFTGGKMALPAAEAASQNISAILKGFREKKLPVIHIQHESVKEGSTFFLPNTDGQKIHDSVAPLDNEIIISKNFPNSFLQTELQTQLQQLNIRRLVITGMMTFMCVDATTREAKDLGYECILAHDCTATPPIEFGGTSCSDMQAKAVIVAALSFICDRVASVPEILETLEG